MRNFNAVVQYFGYSDIGSRYILIRPRLFNLHHHS